MTTRAISPLICVLVLSGCLAACGSESSSPPGATSSARAPKQATRPDYEGGEKSIEGFGSQATADERESILTVEQSYLSAIGAHDYHTACTYLSASVIRSLRQTAPSRSRARGCPTTVPNLLAPTAAPIARQQAAGRITKVRVGGAQAFVIFHAPGARLYVLAMLRENDGWKATTLAPSILVPATEM